MIHISNKGENLRDVTKNGEWLTSGMMIYTHYLGSWRTSSTKDAIIINFPFAAIMTIADIDSRDYLLR